MDLDVIVVGAGSAGMAAAREAARLGCAVLVVDPFDVGDGSTRTGAVPLAVLRDVARASGSREAHAQPAALRSEIEGAVQEGRARAAAHAADARQQLGKFGVRTARGLGSITGPRTVSVGGRARYQADSIVIATGSRARRPERFDWASGVVHDAQTFLACERLPRDAMIVGAEEEGCEFAGVLSALGVQVTLVERRRKLFRLADRDVLEHLHEGFRHLGVTVANEEEIEDVEIRGEGADRHALVRLGSGRVEPFERMLVIAGRVPRYDASELREIKVERDPRGFLFVDENGRTSLPWLFAIGDVAGPPFRIGTAEWQARAAIAAAVLGRSVSPGEFPAVVQTVPQIATVGFGEDACVLLGRSVIVGRASERDLLVSGLPVDPLRLLKLIFDSGTRALLGVQIAGGAAAELIQIGSLLLAKGATAEEIAALVVSHPTQCDGFRAAALDAIMRSGVVSRKAAGDG